MGNERVIFSNRFDRPTLEQIEEEMKTRIMTITKT